MIFYRLAQHKYYYLTKLIIPLSSQFSTLHYILLSLFFANLSAPSAPVLIIKQLESKQMGADSFYLLPLTTFPHEYPHMHSHAPADKRSSRTSDGPSLP